MKKYSIFKALGITVIAGSVVFFAACANGKDTAQTPVNQSPASNAVSNSIEAKNVSLEKAIEIALSDANIAKENARLTKTNLDSNDKIPHYEIEFIAGNKEYDYDIAVSDGKILEIEKENEYNSVDVSKPEQTKAANSTAAKTNAQKPSGYISVDDAKAVALKSADVNSADVIFEKASFDSDDYVPHYDIEFYANGYEYDYEIAAADGKVLEKSKEKEHVHKTPIVTAAGDYISKDEAKSKAFAHAKVNAANIKALEIELDADEVIPHYDIEFRTDGVEYEYKINASSGEVITSEKERF